jgi:HAD superfamily hydrolase (TIGR01484 family)
MSPTRAAMRPLSDFAVADRRAIRGLFFDIDDTLTTDGVLTADAYSAIERLQRVGILTIPITGRPAGWCDHIARMWPVDSVVGENGAFYFRYDRAARRMHRRFVDDAAMRVRNRERLKAIGEEIVRSVPGAAIAADQQYRETDLAIDFCEDVLRLPSAAVQRIAALMREAGLTAKVSSIHVNGWFGAYDKLTMARLLMRECHALDLDRERAQFAFIGDSPNDAPAFAYFPHSIGVANVRDFESELGEPPTYVTRAPCGAGFCEAVDHILAARAGNAQGRCMQ